MPEQTSNGSVTWVGPRPTLIVCWVVTAHGVGVRTRRPDLLSTGSNP